MFSLAILRKKHKEMLAEEENLQDETDTLESRVESIHQVLADLKSSVSV